MSQFYTGGGGSSSSSVLTLTGNSGGAISPTAGNINTVGTGSITIVGSGSTLTTQLTGLTNHNVLVGAGTATVTSVAPSAVTGNPFVSNGSSADPSFSANINACRPITTVSGTSKTFALADANTWQQCSNAATQTLTVDTNANVAFPINTEIELFQDGAGQVVVAAAGGVTINSAFGNLKIASQYTGAVLKKTDTNIWKLWGNLTA